jgi:hypothetical protein
MRCGGFYARRRRVAVNSTNSLDESGRSPLKESRLVATRRLGIWQPQPVTLQAHIGSSGNRACPSELPAISAFGRLCSKIGLGWLGVDQACFILGVKQQGER